MTEESNPTETGSAGRRYHVWLRNAFVVLLVGGMACGWFSMALQKGQRQQDAVKGIRELGGKVYFDYQWSDGKVNQEGQPTEAVWLRKLLGDALFDRAVAVDLRGVEQVDETMHWLRLMPYVRYVDASGTRLTDMSLAGIQRVQSLQHLDLSRTQVSDTGLGHLSRLPRLVVLALADTAVTDSGLETLAGLPQLQRLDMTGTKITQAATEKLQTALPKCEIQR